MRTTYSLQEYFYYTRLERNAGIALCLLCAITWLLPFTYPRLVAPSPKLDFTEISRFAAMLVPVAAPENADGGSSLTFRSRENKSPRQMEAFPFDPNTATKADFERLGLAARTAQTILNYREKGGHFYKKEDLKRIYTIRQADYQRLEPFIQIPPKSGKEKLENFPKSTDNQSIVTRAPYEEHSFVPQNFAKKNSSTIVDINAASVDDWQQIRGIGPGWAKRITNYREKLGGFTSANQVAETFGLPDSVFQVALPQMQLGTTIYRKIKLNTATLDELKAHPYLSSFQATILFNYRQQHGSYTDLASVKKVKAGFKEEDWKRLEPYFSYE